MAGSATDQRRRDLNSHQRRESESSATTSTRSRSPRSARSRGQLDPDINLTLDDEERTLEEDDDNMEIDNGKEKDKSYAKAARPIGKYRLICEAGSASSPITITQKMYDLWKLRFTTVIQNQHDQQDEEPILIDDFWFYGGRVIIEPANENSQTLIQDLVFNRVKVGETGFFTTQSASMDPTVTCVFRTESPGKIDDLLLCPKRGVARLNSWSLEKAPGMRILKYPTNEQGVRYTRVACSSEVVDRIKLKEGTIHCGLGKATVQWKTQLLKSDVQVDFNKN